MLAVDQTDCTLHRQTTAVASLFLAGPTSLLAGHPVAGCICVFVAMWNAGRDACLAHVVW